MRQMALRFLLAVLPAAALGQEAASRPVLPPEVYWAGQSRELLADPKDPWATPAEQSGMTRTPRYDETVAWLQMLAKHQPQLKLVSLGKSPEGRDIWMVVASREWAFTPKELRAVGKPTLLVQAGIHAGEIDGKDAGLMLLRDLTARRTKQLLLQDANLLFIPIFNVDGHERFSAFTRINQRGPAESGWRTTSRNLNLNRDYAKLDAPEMRALVKALNDWAPDLYLDLHVTDGADYQYDITFGGNGKNGYSPAIAQWLDESLQPSLEADLTAAGHIPGPLTQLADDKDPAKGILDWTAGPRYSNGYGDARHLPTLLVENHSLKPYAQRVLGTYVLIEGALKTLGHDYVALRHAVAEDRSRLPAEIPLDFKRADGPTGALDFKAIQWKLTPSSVSGATRIEWLGTPATLHLPVTGMQVSATTTRPAAYWIPPAWGDVIERLALHGVQMERLSQPREVDVELYRIGQAKLGEPFEGHVPVSGTYTPERHKQRFPVGSARIPTDQPLGDLAALLLEPASADSFFQWGFFLEILTPTEYVESYVMEPMAERMLREDPALRREFEKKLSQEPAFAKSPGERLQWLYRRTPFYDPRSGLYPVGRELAGSR